MEVLLEIKTDGVKGYEGTGKIMFVGLNPSLGHFPSNHDIFFYNQLKILNWENAHITDIIKIKLSNEDARSFLKDEKKLSEQIDLLKEEINIINPEIIISVGKDAKKILDKYKINSSKTPHYSYRRWGIDKEKEIIKELEKLKNKIKK